MNKEENTIKVTKPVLTDADALEIIKKNAQSQIRFCDTWVPRTILYPVAVEYKLGVYTNEIRAFVRQGEWCHSATWERALQIEKDYPLLAKKNAESLKAQKKPLNIKPPANNATPLGVNL